MKRYRSLLAVVLAAIATFLFSCSSPQVTAKGPTYTPEQFAQIQSYREDLQVLRERMLEIPPLVQKGDWVDVQTFIHGPLGELRFRMNKLARLLEPQAQKQALQVSRDVFGHLNEIDLAAQTTDARKALLNYNEALKDFDAFLKLIPESAA
ncbi:MAG TPA: photosystem II protein PsbQ [Synechococcales cyanobacterium M55_K2018_004]|nr:photosystem II protein PsbQ [Synechococcales cyanobacterium M55_K2018_004]